MASLAENCCLSPAEAAEEVRIIVENIHRFHPKPFHVTTKDDFYSVVDELLARAGDLSTSRQFFDLTRLTSLIFDTHTQIHISKDTPGFDSSYPLRFKIFPDGLYIIAGSDAYRNAIAKKVVSMGGQQPDDILNRLAHHASSDHFLRKRVWAEILLYLPETYDYLGLKSPTGTVELVLQDRIGKQSTLGLSDTWEKSYDDFSWDRLNPFIPEELLTVHDILGTNPPLYQQNINDNYWFDFLDDDIKCMYIQINKQFDAEEKHSIEFHLEWTQALWDSTAETVIVDLRNVPGGMTSVGSGIPKFLENILYSRSEMKGVAVLMGLDTVSAGTILLAELEQFVWPVLIGAPTGSSPNMFLNAHKLALPYSKLQLEVSKDNYISVHESDPRAYIAPDIPMALTFEDFANGRDPLLETAKSVNKEMMEKVYQGANHLAPWKRNSQQVAIR